MTPADLLDHVGRLFGLPSQERRTRTKALLELTGLSQVGKRRIGGFSAGRRPSLGGAAGGIIARGKLVVEAPQAELLDRYTVPAFELECEEGSEPAFEALLEALRGLEWVTSAAAAPQAGAAGRVVVKDLEIARRELL